MVSELLWLPAKLWKTFISWFHFLHSSNSFDSSSSSLPSIFDNSSMANQSSYSDYLTNPSNPYFCHGNENPSHPLVTPVLSGPNYHTWARAMRIALLSKNKLKFVDGTITAPIATESLYNAWERCNTMVLAWIHRSVSESILPSILCHDKACDAWWDLQRQFSHGDIFRIPSLEEDIYKMHQGYLSVTDYFTQMKTLWDELETFKPIPYCKCSISCTCGGYQTMRNYRDQRQVARFLRGLNEQYAHVRSQIMMMKPLPDAISAFSLVIQQEREMNLDDSDANVETKVFAANTEGSQQQNSFVRRGTFGRGRGRGNQGRGQSGKLWTYCGRNNHTVDTCFHKHGFPPGYKPRGARSAYSLSTDTDDCAETPIDPPVGAHYDLAISNT